MSEPTTQLRPTGQLDHVDARLIRYGAVGGLLGGLVLFVQMAIYNGVTGMGFWSILNSCFAAFVFPEASMGAMGESMMEHGMEHGMAMDGPIVASHLAVGALLHLGLSALAGIAFVLVLALLLRAGIRILANPVAYVVAAMVGGALLYMIMMYGVSPALNPEIVQFTPHAPFFVGHLLFGATVGAFVSWRCAPGRLAGAVPA